LVNAQSKISISVDVWTSSNYISFLGIVAHFVDASYKQRDVLIAFRDLHGDHTGARQAGVILNVMREFDFTRNFNCFVGDNASSNHSTLIRGLGLEPYHRIRCAGHTINLVVKATLYGNGVSKFEEDLAKAAPLEQFKLYRSRGVIGKLHNFVTAVCGSHKRRELFKSVYKDLDDEDQFWSFVNLQLVKDGGIRWHSVYLILLRCWDLREPISRFQRKYHTMYKSEEEFEDGTSGAAYDPITDGLTPDEWFEVETLKDFLVKPYDLTKALEGSNSKGGYGSLWQTIVNLQTLWEHYNDHAESFEPDSFMCNAIKYGQQKLDTYWEKLIHEPTPSYLLHRYRLTPQTPTALVQG
jgi:hypothetical protein